MSKEHLEIDRDLRIAKSTRTVWHVVRSCVKYAVATVSLAVFYYIVFALVLSTDSEKKLIRENKLYERTYADMLEREQLLSDAIDGLLLKDNQIYGEIFHVDAPEMDPILSDDYLSAADTIPDKKMVEYAEERIADATEAAAKVEANFMRILSMCASDGTAIPPMSLPLKSVTYAQVGASTGSKVNPFYKVATSHAGLDLIATQGEPVQAAADGTVTDVSRSHKGQGNVVEITHAGGYVTRYAHLGDVFVSKGQKVSRGRKIATVGLSGNSFAPHLHYEILKDSLRLDPVDYFFASVSPDEYANFKYMASRTEQSLD